MPLHKSGLTVSERPVFGEYLLSNQTGFRRYLDLQVTFYRGLAGKNIPLLKFLLTQYGQVFRAALYPALPYLDFAFTTDPLSAT